MKNMLKTVLCLSIGCFVGQNAQAKAKVPLSNPDANAICTEIGGTFNASATKHRCTGVKNIPPFTSNCMFDIAKAQYFLTKLEKEPSNGQAKVWQQHIRNSATNAGKDCTVKSRG